MTAWAVFGALAAVFILVFTISMCRVSGEASDAAVEFQRVEALDTAAAPEPEKTAFVRWPVPLDDELQQYIVAQCREKDVDPSIVFAVIGVESQYNADAIGDHGNSFGLMQIYRSVHQERMERLGALNLLDPYDNVRVGIDILAELISWGNGVEWALSFYCGNGGAECEYARTVMRNAECLLEGVMTVWE